MAVVLAALAGSVSTRAHGAADDSAVEELIHRGLELRHAGQDGRALPLFRQAYEADRTPRTAGQLGLCELALGYWVDAETHLGEATAAVGNPWVDKNRDTLATSLERTRDNVGRVSVQGAPVGAKVLLDHQEAGALPLDGPLRLNKGPHDLELRAPGSVTQAKSLVVRGRDEQTVTLILVAVPAVAAEPPQPLAGPQTVTTSDQPAPSETKRTLAWVTGGAAVVALVVGVVETVSWLDDSSKFDDHIGPPSAGSALSVKNCGSDDPMYGGPGCQGIHDDLARARTLAFVGYGVGAALGATAIILFETSRSAEPKTSTALSCAPDLLGEGLSCRMSF